MNLGRLRAEIKRKAGARPVTYTREQLAPLEPTLEDPAIREYLQHCLTEEGYGASGVNVLDRERIVDELAAAPMEYLFPFDYVPIATDVGGNFIVVHAWGDRGAKVWWADHTGFSEDRVSYNDRVKGEWVYLTGLTVDNIGKALVPLDTDLEHFLLALLNDELAERLEALDS